MIRPLIIYQVIKNKYGDRFYISNFKDVIVKYLPYLLLLVCFIVYRVFFVSSVLYKVQNVNELLQSPIHTFWGLLVQQFRNFYTALIGAWSQIIKPFGLINPDSIVFKVYLSVLLMMVIFAYLILNFWINNSGHEPKDVTNNKWMMEAFTGSAFIMITAGMPFWAANLAPGLSFPYDRLLLPFMLPASILIVTLLSVFWNHKKTVCVFFALVFGFSSSFHIFKADIYRNEWDDLKQFFYQISVRIPSISIDSILVTDELPLKYYSDNSLSAALNWLYAVQTEDGKMSYLINYTKARLGTSLPSLNANTNIIQKYRIVQFTGSTDKMIIFYHQPPGCVHICDPELDPFNPLLPSELRAAAALSNLNLINPEYEQNDVYFINREKQESWCVYYQKASLALQMKDYHEIASLGDIAFSLNDHPNDASERFPFIEGYAHSDQWKKAIQLTDATHDISELYDPMICRVWQRIDKETKDTNEKARSLSSIQNQYKCDFNQE